MLELEPLRLVQTHFGCRPEDLAPTVVLTTHWPPEAFAKLWDEAPEDFQGWFNGTTGSFHGRRLSVILTHNGACRVGQAMLVLNSAGVKNFVLIGRSSGLLDKFELGDVVVVRTSICGESFSRYHGADHFLDDPFGWRVSIEDEVVNGAVELVRGLLEGDSASVYAARAFSADSMLSHDRELGEYVKIKGGHVIDGETSTAYAVGRVQQVETLSLQCVTALPLAGKPLFAELDPAEVKRLERVHQRMPRLSLEIAAAIFAE
jgi:uridine phosphorylase